MAASSKKSRSKSSGSPRSYSEIYKSSAANAAPVASAPAAVSTANATAATPASQTAMLGSDSVDWKGEYGYVLADLKRLGLVTAIIAGAIIVVGFFI